MLKYTIFVFLFGTTLAHFGSGEDRRNREDGIRFPRPTFLRDVEDDQRQAWFEIVKDRNSTKAEIQQAQDQWASNQSSEVQEEYNQWKQEVINFIQNVTAKADEIAATLSQEAQDVYNQIKGIRLNPDITQREECEQIREAISNITREVRRELKAIRGLKGMCGHRRGHGKGYFGGFPGFGNNGNGDFGGQGFGNGGFPGNNGFGRPGNRFGSEERQGFGGQSDSNSNEDNSNDNSNNESSEEWGGNHHTRPSRRPHPTGFPTLVPSDVLPTEGGFFSNIFG